MRILALDLATSTGWAYKDRDFVCSGVWDFKKKKKEVDGDRLRKLFDELNKFHRLEKFELVAYERPGNLEGHARKVLPAFQAVTELWCSLNSLPVVLVPATKVKKHATGNGRAKKEEMMNAARRNWPGVQLQTHDQADALWVLDCCEKCLNPSELKISKFILD